MKPKIALIVAAKNAAPKLRRYDATARGSSTVCTNASQCIVEVLNTSAASGSSTSALRKNVVNPSVRPKPGRMLGCRSQAISAFHRRLGARGVDEQDGA